MKKLISIMLLVAMVFTATSVFADDAELVVDTAPIAEETIGGEEPIVESEEAAGETAEETLGFFELNHGIKISETEAGVVITKEDEVIFEGKVETTDDKALVLNKLGILKGDENGNFNLSDNVTRAEFSTFVVRALNYETLATIFGGGETNFADVPADHWAVIYINLANKLSPQIIKGTSETTFEPEADVLRMDALTMIIRALDGEAEADKLGGYPAGFVKVAEDNGIYVDGVTKDPATRGDIVDYIYNAFKVPYFS